MPKQIINYIKKIDVEESGGSYIVRITLTNDKVFVFPVLFPIVAKSGLWRGKEIAKMPRVELIKAFNELGKRYQKLLKKSNERKDKKNRTSS